MTMAIFMTVREEYEDGLWRGKDVVACLGSQCPFVSFSFYKPNAERLLMSWQTICIVLLVIVVYVCIFSVCMATACMHGMSLLRFSTALKMCR